MEPAIPLIPTVAPSSRHVLPTLLWILGILVVAGIAIGLFIHFTVPGGFRGVANAWSLPQELRGATFIASAEGKSSVYRRQSAWYEVHHIPGEVTGASIHGDVILARTDSGYGIFEGGTLRTQVDQVIEAPSIPPVLRTIVFAKQIQTPEIRSERPFASASMITNPAYWQIQLLLPEASTATPVIAGYAPLFVDDSTFLFIAADGIYRYAIDTGEATKLLDRPFPVILTPVIQSPDRTLMAFRDLATHSTSVYQLDADGLKIVATVSEQLQSPTLSNTALYDVKGTPKGSEVWKYLLNGAPAERIHTFSRDLAVTQIVF